MKSASQEQTTKPSFELFYLFQEMIHRIRKLVQNCGNGSYLSHKISIGPAITYLFWGFVSKSVFKIFWYKKDKIYIY